MCDIRTLRILQSIIYHTVFPYDSGLGMASAVGRVTPGVGDARAGKARGSDTVGDWRASFDAAAGRRRGQGEGNYERRIPGGNSDMQLVLQSAANNRSLV